METQNALNPRRVWVGEGFIKAAQPSSKWHSYKLHEFRITADYSNKYQPEGRERTRCVLITAVNLKKVICERRVPRKKLHKFQSFGGARSIQFNPESVANLMARQRY
jgi:hypothetical protein